MGHGWNQGVPRSWSIYLYSFLFVCFTEYSWSATIHWHSTEQQHFCQYIHIFRAKLVSFSVCGSIEWQQFYALQVLPCLVRFLHYDQSVVLGSLRTVNINEVFLGIETSPCEKEKGQKRQLQMITFQGLSRDKVLDLVSFTRVNQETFQAKLLLARLNIVAVWAKSECLR